MKNPPSAPNRSALIPWILLILALCLTAVLFTSTPALAQEGGEINLDFDFEIDSDGWAVGFADLPADYDQQTFELDHGHRSLPEGLQGNGIYVQGHNRSDDLFMYLKRQVEGLRPDTSYTVLASIDLATNVPGGLIGIGGSPGESVFVKAGASTVEPTAQVGDNQHLRMNIDKGNQSQSGRSMVVIGKVSHPGIARNEYRIKTLDNTNPLMPLMVDSDSQGRVWLIVGTDSGFEGLTTLYYSRINYTLTPSIQLPTTGDPTLPPWAPPVAMAAGSFATALGLVLITRSRRLRTLPEFKGSNP